MDLKYNRKVFQEKAHKLFDLNDIQESSEALTKNPFYNHNYQTLLSMEKEAVIDIF